MTVKECSNCKKRDNCDKRYSDKCPYEVDSKAVTMQIMNYKKKIKELQCLLNSIN